MTTRTRHSLSALLAATAVLGLPAANAAAALTAPAATPQEKAKAAAAAAAAKKAAAAKTAAAEPPQIVVGDTFEMSRWGPVTVILEVSGKKIVAVSAQYPSEKSRSRVINERVVPYLNDRVMATQGMISDVVSGATQTCEVYELSLQSALDKAGIKATAAAAGA